MSGLYIMMTICSRKNMPEFVSYYKKNKIKTGNISLGRGTASSSVLDYLGLEDDEKGIHAAVVTTESWNIIKNGLLSELQIDIPGKGIVFIIPMSSVGGKKELGFMIEGQQFEREEESGLKDTKYELIIAIANYGYNTQVMKAAQDGGAAGGTVSLVSEKEVILIVARSEQKNSIMNSIMEKAGVTSKAGTIVFSLPVTSTAGLRSIEDI